MFITVANNIFLQKVLYLANMVEIFPAYSGKRNSVCHAQSLQGFIAYFQKCTNLVAVHPDQ
jgi:hypothetical protein